MAHFCVNCNNPIDQDFGIVACGQCGSVMSIDFDGNIQLAEEEAPPQELDNRTNISQEDSTQSEEPSVAIAEYDPELGLHVDSPELIQELQNENWTLPSTQTVSSYPESLAEVPNSRNSQGPEDSIREIRNFGNQEQPEATALTYDLDLSGIESSAVKQEVLAVLSETRLQLNREEVDQSFREGSFFLKGLNAAKVSFILHQVSHLEIRSSWRQHLFNSYST